MKLRLELFRLSLPLIFTSAAFLIAPNTALAGRLEMVGEPNVQLTEGGGNVTLKLSFPITNRGDESSKEVFPWLQFGGATFAGEPKVLTPGQSFTWEIERSYPTEKLQCGADSEGRCAGLNLPVRGAIPLFIRRHYQDMNGASFSAPSLSIKLVGELSEEERLGVQVPYLTFSPIGANRLGVECRPMAPLFSSRGVDLEGKNLSFNCRAELRNSSSLDRQIALTAFTARELQVVSPTQQVNLPGGGSVKVEFSVENSSALLGSSYPLILVAQWEDGGVRRVVQSFGKLSIEKVDRTALLLGVAVGAVAFLGLLMYVFVFRETRKKESKGSN